MQLLSNNEINDIKNSSYFKDKFSVTDVLIENFYNEILKNDEKELLRFCFSINPTQDRLDNLMTKWDIDVKGSEKSLLLSYMLKNHPHLKFSSSIEPRLKGLLNYYRFYNLKVIAHFSKIGRILNQNNITPMLIKGVAMKYIRPQLPRVMNDCDILVSEDDFLKCEKLTKFMGYWWEKIANHSIDLHPENSNDGAVDIHKYFDMDSSFEKKYLPELFYRSTEAKAFGVKCLIPSYEDMLFISLINLSKNLRNRTSQAGLLFTLFDSKFLIEQKRDFDWNIVKNSAKITKTQVQINFAAKFIEKISSDILPNEITEKKLFENETKKYSTIVLYNRFYLEDLRIKCKELPIRKMFLSFDNFINYFKIKPKYYLLKLIKNSPFLIDLLIKDLKTKIYRCKS